MQTLVSDPLYLTDLELKETAAAELIRFEHLARATFATWLSLQALCVLDYWTAGPFDLEELGESLSGYMREFMGLSVPPAAIRVLPTFVRTLRFNTVGYPVAYARLGHLLAELEASRRDWWHSPAAVRVVRGYMRGRRKGGVPRVNAGYKALYQEVRQQPILRFPAPRPPASQTDGSAAPVSPGPSARSARSPRR